MLVQSAGRVSWINCNSSYPLPHHSLQITIIRSGKRGREVRRYRGRLAVREEGKREEQCVVGNEW